MSSTRRATDRSVLRQERFASSPARNSPLMANLVAKRVEDLVVGWQRALVWWIQWRSLQRGGLGALAEDLMRTFPERVATKSMIEFGTKPGTVYTADMVRQVREELDGGGCCGFLLKGEDDPFAQVLGLPYNARAASNRPETYPVESFVEECRKAAADLPLILAQICLDPAIDIEAFEPWFFPGLVRSLVELQKAQAAASQKGLVTTDVGRRLNDALEYARASRCLVLADGPARTGKTFAVKAWAARRPGTCRIVQVPPSNDMKGWFRAIAASLGVSVNLNSKALDLRERVEEVLLSGDIMLVFDEGHYLWPQTTRPTSMPDRVNWLMVALVNNNVPVAIITTPQFYHAQKSIERLTGWSSEQFMGRIGHVERLPERIGKKDLIAVARSFLGDGLDDVVLAVATYAATSSRHLASIEAIARRAKFLAGADGRDAIEEDDVRRAMGESVLPSDRGLIEALEVPAAAGRSGGRSARRARPVSVPTSGLSEPDLSGRLQDACDRSAMALQSSGRGSELRRIAEPDAIVLAGT